MITFSFRESLRLTHGSGKSFVLAFSRQLGTVHLVNVEWRYDHDIDPLDPLKVCVLLLCSDAIYMESLAINSVISPASASTSTAKEAGLLPAPADTEAAVKKS